MEFKIEIAGIIRLGASDPSMSAIITLEHICRVCERFINEAEPVISAEERTKLCRTCTKQLAKFFDDNRSAIISM